MCETRGESPGAEGRGYRSTVLRESEGRGPSGCVMEEPRAGLSSRSLPSAGDSLADIFGHFLGWKGQREKPWSGSL